MNKLVQEQLDKVKDADLSHFDSASNTYFIPRKTTIKIEEEKAYLINIKNTMLVPNTINTNWNNGEIPPFTKCKAMVIVYMKGMIKIQGIEVECEDIPKVWNGWLPLSEIEVIKEL